MTRTTLIACASACLMGLAFSDHASSASYSVAVECQESSKAMFLGTFQTKDQAQAEEDNFFEERDAEATRFCGNDHWELNISHD